MNSVFEPRSPAPGWLLRWARQAAELMYRSLLPLTGAAVGFNLACFACLASIAFIGVGTPLMWLPIAMTRILAILNLLVVVQIVMRADGHRPEQHVLSLNGLRLIVPVAFIECTIMLVAMLGRGDLAPEPGDGAALSGDIASQIVMLVIWLHGSGMASVLTTTCILGVFWPALMVSFGLSLPSYYGNLYQLMIARMPSLCIRLVGVGIVYAMLISRLPFWAIQLAGMFGAAWTYVGAREIFGGIAQNGKQEVAAPAAAVPNPV